LHPERKRDFVNTHWSTFVLATLLALALPSAALAGKKPPPNFVDKADQSLPAPPADKAQIVFLEPINGIQGLVPVGLYEMDGENRKLLAITGSHTKVSIEFTPGHHFLMANQSGLIAHFLDVNVEAGKRYYVLLRFIYAHGFQMRPLRTSGPSDYSVVHPKFNSWWTETRFVEMTPDGIKLFEETMKENIDKTQAKGLQQWQERTPEERAELTLTPQDAVAEAGA
jgi:hypothetical protein